MSEAIVELKSGKIDKNSALYLFDIVVDSWMTD